MLYWDGERWLAPVAGNEAGKAANQVSDQLTTTPATVANSVPVTESLRFELSPAPLGAAMLGTGLCVLGLFLPANQAPAGVSRVISNSLIQQGVVVWSIVIFGAMFVVNLARAYQQKRPLSLWALLFPVTAGGTTATLLGGSTLEYVATKQSVHAAAGIGVYVVVAGAVMAAVGIIGLRASPGRALTQCPRCAELVLADARVCRHCSADLARHDLLAGS